MASSNPRRNIKRRSTRERFVGFLKRTFSVSSSVDIAEAMLRFTSPPTITSQEAQSFISSVSSWENITSTDDDGCTVLLATLDQCNNEGNENVKIALSMQRVVKVMVVNCPSLCSHPCYVEAAIQMLCSYLLEFCPHFCILDTAFRGHSKSLPPGCDLLEREVSSLEVDNKNLCEELDDAEFELFADVNKAKRRGRSFRNETFQTAGNNVRNNDNEQKEGVPVLFLIQQKLDGGHKRFIEWSKQALNAFERGEVMVAYELLAAWLFQVVYAIYCAQQWFSLCHNDLHHENVMIEDVFMKDGDVWTYTVPINDQLNRRTTKLSRTFHLPARTVQGRRIRIIDFGLAHIKGVHFGAAGTVSQTLSYYHQKSTSKTVSDETVRVYEVQKMELEKNHRLRIQRAIINQELYPMSPNAKVHPEGPIKDLRLSEFVPGYDISVYGRHQIAFNPAFREIVSLAFARSPASTEDLEFRSFMMSLLCAPEDEAVFIQRFLTKTTTVPNTTFDDTSTPMLLRPSIEEQDLRMRDPNIMSRLLLHSFLHRCLSVSIHETQNECILQDTSTERSLTVEAKSECPSSCTNSAQQSPLNLLRTFRRSSSESSMDKKFSLRKSPTYGSKRPRPLTRKPNNNNTNSGTNHIFAYRPLGQESSLVPSGLNTNLTTS